MMKSDPIPRRRSYQSYNLSPSSIMGDTSSSNVSLQKTHKPNPILEPLLHALDPISLILNQNSHSLSEQQSFSFPLRLTSADSFIMERGPNYDAYAELREKRLRMKQFMGQEQEQEESQGLEPKIALAIATPPKKQVKFQSDLGCGRKLGFSSVAQSVPDFSSVLRKENKKPVMNTLPPMKEEMTPPSKRGINRVLSSSRGSKSASGGEKGGGGGGVLMARKSYASIDELKRLSCATAIAINGEGRGGRNGSKMMGRTVSGKNRQF